MATLKRKTSGGWTTVAPPYPAQITKHVTEIAPNFTTLNATTNGVYTPQAPYNGFSSAVVNVTTGGLPAVIRAGDTPVLMCHDAFKATGTSALVQSDVSLTMPRAGTYRFKWGIGAGEGSGYEVKSRLYVNGSAKGTEHSSQTPEVCTEDLTVSANDVVTLWVRGYSDSGTWGSVSDLTACIDWNIWG